MTTSKSIITYGNNCELTTSILNLGWNFHISYVFIFTIGNSSIVAKNYVIDGDILVNCAKVILVRFSSTCEA